MNTNFSFENLTVEALEPRLEFVGGGCGCDCKIDIWIIPDHGYMIIMDN